MHLLHLWLAEQLASGHQITDSAYRELVHLHVYTETGREHFLPDMYTCAIAALVIQKLHQAGLSPRYWGLDGRPMDLAADIRSLVELQLSLDMNGLGSRMHGTDTAVMRILHSFGDRLAHSITGALSRLHRNLRERLETWH